MTFTYNGAELARTEGPNAAAPIVAVASSWAWGAVFSRVAAGCGLAACGFVYTFAESLWSALCGIVAFAFQTMLLEWGRAWYVRRRERRMQAVGVWMPWRRAHPVLHWIAAFVVIELCGLIAVAAAWNFFAK